ncbi:hypothetical protein AT727_24035 [Desulfitobacterium hafniense]|uniref:Uncharacterized protein n=1 Tax=Desulfitobacterium hafniense TaxID=49338 RepID=A0A0W1JFW1_DESHA|nr:tetratricopeptide repeat protein [Desulfitobacterium hafniense]KTE90737.1 hypothetical protein AT727_24035 [Desulfitobacterium hafniense]
MIIIAILIAIIVPSFGWFLTVSDKGKSVFSANDSNLGQQSLKNQVEALRNEVKVNPQDPTARLKLANAYYDLGEQVRHGTAPDQAIPYFKQAVEEYKEVIKIKQDINVLVDMATAAFRSGQYELAEKTFNEAITAKPDFLNALVNYGMFLMDAKGLFGCNRAVEHSIDEGEPYSRRSSTH